MISEFICIQRTKLKLDLDMHINARFEHTSKAAHLRLDSLNWLLLQGLNRPKEVKETISGPEASKD